MGIFVPGQLSGWRPHCRIGCFSSLLSLQLQRSDIYFPFPKVARVGSFSVNWIFFFIGKKYSRYGPVLNVPHPTRVSSEELRLCSPSCMSRDTRLSTSQTHARAFVFVPSVKDGHVGSQKDIPEDPEGSLRLRDVQGLETQQAEANIAV